MKVERFRLGFERTLQITGLVAAAFVIAGILDSYIAPPRLPTEPGVLAVATTASLLTLKTAS